MLEKDIDLIDPLANEDTFIQYDNKNPFYLSVDERRFQKSDLEYLKKEYNRIYILTVRDNFNAQNIRIFYDKNSDLNKLIELREEIILVEAPLDLLDLDKIFDGIIRVDRNILKNFNHNNYKLNENEIVYLMLGSQEKFVSRWARKHERNQLTKFVENVLFRNYYQFEDFILDNRILNSIRNIPDFLYWSDEKNCKITSNKYFRKRFFNLKNTKVDSSSINITKIFDRFVRKKSNYNLEEEYTIDNELEILKIDQDSNKYDFDFSNCEFSVVEIEELINILKPKEKYLFIWGLLISRKYYHYIINNPNINFEDLSFHHFLPIYKCILRYTWIMAILEERKNPYNIKQSDRFIFDIKIASKLPSFPFSLENIYTSPYIPPFIDLDLFSKYRVHGICSIMSDYGIVDLQEFRRRMNIFITGNAEKNIFEGANWSNMVVTGGIMAATLPKLNPLIFNFVTDNTITDTSLDRFYDEYYHYTDVDIACNHSSILDFMNHVIHIMNVIKENTNSNEINVTPNKSMNIYLNKSLIEEKCKRGEIPFKFDYLIENLDAKDVRLYFYEMYLDHKKKSNENTKRILGDKLNNCVYFAAASYCQFDNITITVSDSEINVINSDCYKSSESNNGIDIVYYSSDDRIYAMFSENIKYSISTPALKHSFELFRISNNEFFSTISRFHLPCVRAYYNGETCYMTPSAITSYMTLVNIDFKYVGGKNNPIEIIDKYRMRGFTTLMNKKEVDVFVEFIFSLDDERRKYKYINKTSVTGKTNLDYPLFRPRLHVPEKFRDRIELNYNDKLLKESSYSDIVNHYNSIYNFPEKLMNIYSSDKLFPIEFSALEMLYYLLN